MEQLLRKLGINPNQSNESILDELGKKQMEYQERLESVEDEKRRAQLEAELKEMEGVINTLSWLSKRSETGMKREEEPTESFEELKGQPQEKDVETLSVEVQESMQGKTEEELYDAALAIMATPDYAKGVEMMRQLAENGYHPAQCQMGKLYAEGNRVLKDESIATEWYRKAAEQGNAEAQSNLGYRYEAGIGVKQNDNLAAEWYRKAAEQGDAFAQACLGLFYVQGKGVVQSNRQAIVWSEKAAEQGNVIGQGTLGAIYEFDEIYKNDELAAEWYLKAAKQNHIVAAERLIVMYTEKRGNVKKEDLEFAWIEQAAGKGSAEAQCMVGQAYEEGNGVKQDYDYALEWYQKAAQNGDIYSKEKMKFVLADRKGNIEDENRELYLKAFSGDAAAQIELAECYLYGYDYRGFEENEEMAEFWRKSAEEQALKVGSIEAFKKLGDYSKELVIGDYQKAIFWYQKALELGDVSANNDIAYCYRKQGKTQLAVEWYEKAIKEGYMHSAGELALMYCYGKEVEYDKGLAYKYARMVPKDSFKMHDLDLRCLVDAAEKSEKGFFKRLFG